MTVLGLSFFIISISCIFFLGGFDLTLHIFIPVILTSIDSLFLVNLAWLLFLLLGVLRAGIFHNG